MDAYSKLIEIFDNDVKTLCQDGHNVYWISEQGVKLCEETLTELRLLVLKEGFETPQKEIEFYKKINPL